MSQLIHCLECGNVLGAWLLADTIEFRRSGRRIVVKGAQEMTIQCEGCHLTQPVALDRLAVAAIP